MKIFYHCLIMWVPFIVLFAFAGLGIVVMTGEYRLSDFGPLFFLFISGSYALIFYVVSFLPLTFIVNKFGNTLLFKGVIFTIAGALIGVFVFEVSAIIIFSITGLLYSLIENSVKKNIKFIINVLFVAGLFYTFGSVKLNC